MTSFDRAADIYDQTRGFPQNVGEQVAQALVSLLNLSASDRVLEIGIGTGRIAKPLIEILGNDHRVMGIDLSRNMMDRLCEKFDSARAPDLIQGDAVSLPFASHSFQAILTVHVLHLIRDPQKAITEMNRVRARDGVFVGGWNDHDPDSAAERINKKFRALASAHGISTERQGLANYSDLLPRLPTASATEIVAAEWIVERAPRFALQAIAERHYSSSWIIPDEIFPVVLAEINEWASGEWDDLDRAVPEVRRFKWMKIEF
jgi:ubiquinone/menaquinone biosynthesis C-methylase UbiE